MRSHVMKKNRGVYTYEFMRIQEKKFFSDDILYNVTKTYLDQKGFQKYFSALASDPVAIKGTG